MRRSAFRGGFRVVPAGASLAVAVAVLAGFAAERALPERRPLQPDGAPRVRIDRAHGEVRVPCRFVNPSRQIEVFACHESGPAHETVLVFDATGPELLEALLEIGCRPPDHWNTTSPTDYLRNQGDRVLVLVRWTVDGVTRTLPAEALLLDGETGFPSFVRGFSFSAGAGDPPRDAPGEETQDGSEPRERADAARAIEREVEISLGAAQRQQSVSALLSHPTTLREVADPDGSRTRSLVRWSLEPVVDDEILGGVARLVEAQPPVELVLRRMPSEEALVRYRQAVASERGVQERARLYDLLLPLACEIDGWKRGYEVITGQLKSIVATDLSTVPEVAHDVIVDRAELLRAVGQWLCSRIQRVYFSMYSSEESWKIERIANAEDIEPDVLRLARTLVENGLRFEPALARSEETSRELSVRALLERHQARLLELERGALIERANLGEVEERLCSLGRGDAYLIRLWQEERMRLDVSARRLEALRSLVAANVDEGNAWLAGSWAGVDPTLERTRRIAFEELRILGGEDALRVLLEKIRWEENDLESEDPDRRRKAKENLERLREERETIQAALAELRENLEAIQNERAR